MTISSLKSKEERFFEKSFFFLYLLFVSLLPCNLSSSCTRSGLELDLSKKWGRLSLADAIKTAKVPRYIVQKLTNGKSFLFLYSKRFNQIDRRIRPIIQLGRNLSFVSKFVLTTIECNDCRRHNRTLPLFSAC